MRLLLQAGADVNAWLMGLTPLRLAVEYNQPSVVRELLRHPSINPSRGEVLFRRPTCLGLAYDQKNWLVALLLNRHHDLSFFKVAFTVIQEQRSRLPCWSACFLVPASIVACAALYLSYALCTLLICIVEAHAQLAGCLGHAIVSAIVMDVLQLAMAAYSASSGQKALIPLDKAFSILVDEELTKQGTGVQDAKIDEALHRFFRLVPFIFGNALLAVVCLLLVFQWVVRILRVNTNINQHITQHMLVLFVLIWLCSHKMMTDQ